VQFITLYFMHNTEDDGYRHVTLTEMPYDLCITEDCVDCSVVC